MHSLMGIRKPVCRGFYICWTKRSKQATPRATWNYTTAYTPYLCLQMDGAKPHVGNDNIQLLNERGAQGGFSIQCMLQPPNSPDLNKNDMSFNNSLACQASKIANVRNNSYEDIVYNVVRAFDDYPVDSIYHAYAETFAVYREILKHCGGNDFKMPHGEIRKNESHGLEIVDYYVEVSVVQDAKKWLVENPLPNPDL
jgi:hypothetical protein